MTSNQSTLPTGVPSEKPPEAVHDHSSPLSERNELESNEYNQQYPGGEPTELDYWYNISYCSSHSHPGRIFLNGEQHHQFSALTIDASDSYNEQLKTALTPEVCECGLSIKSRTVEGEWPPEDCSKRRLLNLFRETSDILLAVNGEASHAWGIPVSRRWQRVLTLRRP